MSENSRTFTYSTYRQNKRNLHFSNGTIAIGSGLILIIGYIGILVSHFWGVILFLIVVLPILTRLAWEKQVNRKLISKNYFTWGKGAGAELAVQKTLAHLPPEYRVISDYQTGKGNIDFIIIGPKGIFTIECKATVGFISLHNGKLFSGMKQLDGYIKQTQAEKLWLQSTLQKQFSKLFPVTGLLEFTQGKIDRNTINGQVQNIWIGGYRFHDYLIKNSRNYLTSEEIENIYSFLNLKKEGSN